MRRTCCYLALLAAACYCDKQLVGCCTSMRLTRWGGSEGLLGVRAAVGLGEGVAPSAATDMVARVIAPEERSRAISFVFGGLHVGSLLGLLVAPVLIDRFGWQTVSLLPPIAAIAATAVAGPSADALIARGWPVASVRRLAQATAFLGPAACLTAAAFTEDGPQTVCALLDQTGSWPLALFAPSVFFFLTGIAVFAGLGTSDAQDFSDNGPFWIERKLAPALTQLAAGRDAALGALGRARRLLPGARKSKDS
ncbi:hypothetical protein WJX81_002343 [Elliptochloris bilobata]|uniref:Major facilitator superfamily (MFS) profile domain-containing protein n=1 Tax=Elliptochloris bilobata TaxID=381761 RepID=A0AAW1QNJ0_9CHLO